MMVNILEIYTQEGDNINSYPQLCESLKEDELWSSFIENNSIKLVGSYMLPKGDIIWYSFPKYYEFDNKQNPSLLDKTHLKTLTRVIERLRSEGRNLFDGDHIFAGERKESSQRRVNIIDLSSYLVNDYIQNGIFEKKEKKYFKHGQGNLSWAKTVKKDVPIIDRNIPFYEAPWKYRNVVIDHNITTAVHAYILDKAIDVYKRFNGINIKKPDIIVPFSDTDSKSIVNYLKQELLTVFSDRESNLIKALISWLELTYNYKLAGCTNCFQNVWEWVTDAVFGNQESKQNKESGNPRYMVGNNEYQGGGNAKPDTIYFSNNTQDNSYHLCVYDAKYYTPSFDIKGKAVYGYPSNSDIVKQVAYLKGILNSLSPIRNQLQFKNAFLLPLISNHEMEKIGSSYDKKALYTELGYVLQADFDQMATNLLISIDYQALPIIHNGKKIDNENKVYLYIVNCSKLYEMYLNNKHFIPEF